MCGSIVTRGTYVSIGFSAINIVTLVLDSVTPRLGIGLAVSFPSCDLYISQATCMSTDNCMWVGGECMLASPLLSTTAPLRTYIPSPPTALPSVTDFVALDEDYPNQRNCMVTKYKPRQSRSLRFCSKFSDYSCCNPAQDEKNIDFLQMMIDTGLSCRRMKDLRDDPLGILYCLNCDPNQPTYVRNLPYYPLSTIDGYLNSYPLLGFPSHNTAPLPDACYNISDVGAQPTLTAIGNESSNFKQCFSTRPQQLLVCSDFLNNQFNSGLNILSVFDKCMLQKSAPCLSLIGAIIPNRARFTCGNDLVDPGKFYSSDVTICTDMGVSADSLWCTMLLIERAFNQDHFSTPLIDENFGIRVVDRNHRCSDDEYQAWYSNARAIYQGTAQFNAHVLNGPTCLMTRLQVVHMNTVVLGDIGGTNLVAMHLDYIPEDGEACFNSATNLQAHLGLLIALLSLLFFI